MELDRHGAHSHLTLEEHEASLLRELCNEMRMLLEADIPKSDAVLTRLFPVAYQDPDDTNAYNELVEDELRNTKLTALKEIVELLGDGGPVEVDLSDEQLHSWLTLLTDLRLAIGVRLDVTEEKMAEPLTEEDPDAPAMSVLHWLGWLQERTLEIINPDMETHDAD